MDFQSLAGLLGRMGEWVRSKWPHSISSMPGLNIGSYGMEMALASTTSARQRMPGRRQEQFGYEAYKKKLISEGKYRQRR